MSKFTTIILLMFLSISLFAQEIEKEFKIKLQTNSSQNITIQCDFLQTKKIKKLSQEVTRKGSFYYYNAGLMAMHYSQPKDDKVIMNKDSFVIIISGKKICADAKSNPMMAQISYMMQASMSGDVSKLGRGWIMSIEKQINSYEVILKPTDKRIQKYINSMVMNFRESDMTLDTLRINETSGGFTQYTFTNKKVNNKIDSSYFIPE